MTKHILIILIDYSKFTTSASSSIESIEQTLQETILTDDLDIFYLEIRSATKDENKDILSSIVPTAGNKNKINNLKIDYYFRNGDDIKHAFNYIHELNKDFVLNWYFISIGHGGGLSFFDIDKIRHALTLAAHKNMSLAEFINFQTPGFNYLVVPETSHAIEEHLKDNNLFISEIVDAASDLGEYPFELGLFYNCNLTTVDNCFLLSKKFRYIIGTENFGSTNFIGLEEFIGALKDKITTGSSGLDFTKQIFDIHEKKIKRNEVKDLYGATLFAIQLKNLHKIFSYLNSISTELTSNINESSRDEYKRLRENLTNPLITFYFVDLFCFLHELRSCSFTNETISQLTRLIEDEKVTTIIDNYIKIVIPFEEKLETITSTTMQGLCLYLPKFGHGTSPYFDRVYQSQRTVMDKMNWYEFVRKVAALFKNE